MIERGKDTHVLVAAHHFTEEAVEKYWNDNMVRGVLKLRQDQNNVSKVLHLPLDGCARDADGKYFINANNPIIDAAKVLNTIKLGRRRR